MKYNGGKKINKFLWNFYIHDLCIYIDIRPYERFFKKFLSNISVKVSFLDIRFANRGRRIADAKIYLLLSSIRLFPYFGLQTAKSGRAKNAPKPNFPRPQVYFFHVNWFINKIICLRNLPPAIHSPLTRKCTFTCINTVQIMI